MSLGNIIYYSNVRNSFPCGPSYKINQIPMRINNIPIKSCILILSLKNIHPIDTIKRIDTPLQMQFTIPILLKLYEHTNK